MSALGGPEGPGWRPKQGTWAKVAANCSNISPSGPCPRLAACSCIPSPTLRLLEFPDQPRRE